MFIIGKANDKGIEEMEKLGFEVEPVDVKHFDKALNKSLPDNCPDYQPDPDRYDPDKLVAIFLDCDIVQECRDIIESEAL